MVPLKPIGELPAAAEAISGQAPYLEVLRRIHAQLQPRLYLEIGIRHGASLSLARGPAVAIDPMPEITAKVADGVRVFKCTSDDFFDLHAPDALATSVDLAFIDGMHLFEYALRDFINVERYASPAGLVIVDDVFPNHPIQASRTRYTRVWTGDVWKLRFCLERYRPDLFLLPLDTSPTGLLLVAGLKPGNRALSDRYDGIVREYASKEIEAPPAVISRERAVPPTAPTFGQLIDVLRAARTDGADSTEVGRRLRAEISS